MSSSDCTDIDELVRLALELGDQGVQAVIVGLDTNKSEELLNVSGRGM